MFWIGTSSSNTLSVFISFPVAVIKLETLYHGMKKTRRWQNSFFLNKDRVCAGFNNKQKWDVDHTGYLAGVWRCACYKSKDELCKNMKPSWCSQPNKITGILGYRANPELAVRRSPCSGATFHINRSWLQSVHDRPLPQFMFLTVCSSMARVEVACPVQSFLL